MKITEPSGHEAFRLIGPISVLGKGQSGRLAVKRNQ
jgi:hypothetical protein